MKMIKLREIAAKQRRCKEEYRRLIASRNMIVLDFESEFTRHKNILIAKPNMQVLLRESLKKSHKIYDLQNEMHDIKNRLTENLKNSRELKKLYKTTESKLLKEIK